MTKESFPLLAPKTLNEFTKDEFIVYVKSLYKAPEKKVPIEFTFRFTKTGKPSIIMRRKPKRLTELEFDALCKEHGLDVEGFKSYLDKSKIELVKEIK